VSLKAFYTTHRRRKHSAHALDGRFLIRNVPTEIELVERLQLLGVYLENYRFFNSRGDERFLCTNWERIHEERRNYPPYA
jgi:hypothetical protein